jgi:hypothetical protein
MCDRCVLYSIGWHILLAQQPVAYRVLSPLLSGENDFCPLTCCCFCLCCIGKELDVTWLLMLICKHSYKIGTLLTHPLSLPVFGKSHIPHDIWGFHGSDYEDYYLLEYNAVWLTGRSQHFFNDLQPHPLLLWRWRRNFFQNLAICLSDYTLISPTMSVRLSHVSTLGYFFTF